jgi:hypothetical protein
VFGVGTDKGVLKLFDVRSYAQGPFDAFTVSSCFTSAPRLEWQNMIATQASGMLLFPQQKCVLSHQFSYACCCLHKAFSKLAALWTLSMLSGLEENLVSWTFMVPT